MFNDKRLKMLIKPEEIEQGAVKQIAQCLGVKPLTNLVILPDVHQGYDIPIGAVALLDGYIWPGAVGVDLNCGMSNIYTHKTLNNLGLGPLASRRTFLEELKEVVPFIKTKCSTDVVPFPNSIGDKKFGEKVMQYAHKQIGTLGGGKMNASSPRG